MYYYISRADLDRPMWHMVRELYYLDKVVEALHEAEKLGGKDSNTYFAEAEVRTRGIQRQLRPWLVFESIEADIGDNLNDVIEIVSAECEALSRQFGWDNHETTMVTILPKEVNQPWMPGRWGYFVDKVPYDKVCLPHYLTGDMNQLSETVRHEFMHQITLNLSDGRCCNWLEEGLSTLAEGRLNHQRWEGFQKGTSEWVTPRLVDGILAGDHRDEHKQSEISSAYDQSNFVIHYLVSYFGAPKLVELLNALGHPSLLERLSEQLMIHTPMDSALHEVYGLTEHTLFDKAHEWVMTSRPPAVHG